jgi:hemerythrin
MEIAKWNDSYKTGHTVVDTQHQELFRMVNALHAAIMEERGKEVLMPTLEELAGYTVEHFRSEEQLMAQVCYPAMSVHKQKHADLTKEVKELIEKYKSGKVVLTITLSNFLAKWLRHHIKEDDLALVKFLQGQSKATAASAKS